MNFSLRIKIGLLFNLFIVDYCISQTNLISNPGFENHTTCPNFGAQINYCTNWNNVNLVYGNFSVGTPDYFHTCGSGNVVPPNTFAGQCNPHSGSAMAALVMYNSPFPGYREYMSTPLSCPMTPGNTYTVSFWLTNGLNPISQYRIKNIGIHFSSSSLTQSGYSIINAVPQVEITNYSGSTSWIQYTFTISPTAHWQYITIGNFRSDALNSPTSSYSITTGAPSVYANYFFDDIEVLSSVFSGTVSLSSSATNVSCFGASNGSATVTATGSGNTYLWSPGNYTTSSVSNLSAGLYTVTVNGGSCNVQTHTISIIQPSILSSTLTASSYTVCKNNSVVLNSTVMGGSPSYTVNWNNGIISPSISLTPSITGVYNYTVTDSNNCSKTQSVQINVESTIANFINTTPSCNSLISFTNTSTNTSISLWDFGDGQTSTSNTITTNNYASSGIYTVSLVSFTPFGCKDTIQKTVSVNASNMNLDFDYLIAEYNCIDSISFINKSIGATSYTWNLGNGNTSIQIIPTSVYYPGNYQISLIGSTSSCTDTITKDVFIQANVNSILNNTPNVFTPNGDGVNDVFDFKVMSNCEDFTFEIYDRWGLLMLKMKDKKQSFWDGRTTSGEEVTDGTYFYILITDNGKKLKGTVTVFR